MADSNAPLNSAATERVRREPIGSVSRRFARLTLGDGETRGPVDTEWTLGSAAAVTSRIESPTVSRLHARLSPSDEGLWIDDLESTNGVWVERVRVGRALIPDGARVRLGQFELTVRYDRDESVVPLWPTARFGPLIGRSTAMRELFDRLARVAQSDATVLVQGETGTGKELVAQAIHETSGRAEGPLVVVDCGAISEALFESELFGHVKGAFTGADRNRDGAFQLAAGGTLFLDELGELPPAVQPKLLRALESRTVRRVGESQHRPVDVRVIAATHRDLAREVALGSFREDLYFRVAVLPISVPPLRSRPDDVQLLIEHFAAGRALDVAAAQLDGRPWLGNVRELRTFVERAIVLGESDALRSLERGAASSHDRLPEVELEVPFKEARAEWNDHLERAYLEGWLERTHWNFKEAAKAMGINRTYAHRLAKKHGLERGLRGENSD